MFLEHYKLESNPFVAEAARPVFASHSMRSAAVKLDELIDKQIGCVFLSGPPSVGKTTLARNRFRQLRQTSTAWINPSAESGEAVLGQLLEEVGPGGVSGSATELRRILEVFLSHQAANGRYSYVVADDIERFAAPVLEELEVLAQMRFRGAPLVHMLLLARSEEFVANMLPQYDGGPEAQAIQQRLTGFSLDETRAYVRSCLRSGGCESAEELMSDDVIVDVQGFTQGVVGDVNAICAAALDALARRAAGTHNRPPKVTRSLLKEAGAGLNLRYRASAWAQPPPDETLPPIGVRVFEPKPSTLETARLIVSSGPTVVAEVVLNRLRMVLGRDDTCDISLDSRYVSRFQNLFMETPDGWILIDLSSTNGCFVNGRRIREHRLRDGDLIAIGHHQMRFAGPTSNVIRSNAGEEDSPDLTLITRQSAAIMGSQSSEGKPIS